jgi:hypothetical protein
MICCNSHYGIGPTRGELPASLDGPQHSQVVPASGNGGGPELAVGVLSRFVLELLGAVSGRTRILEQAARSGGVLASLWLSVCHPSTLRIVI